MCAAKSLEGRLLCASEAAYGIENPYFRGVGFLSGTQVKKVSRGVNSCIIGRNMDGVIVAFRGTQGASPLDWLQNAAIQLSDVKDIPGRVHKGFYNGVKALYEPVKAIVSRMLQDETNPERQKIYLTGHSKGGSIASLTAVLFALDDKMPNVELVCTFGAARVGDHVFRDYFNDIVQQYTYENYLDIIPFLPPGNNTMSAMDDKMTKKVDDILWPKNEDPEKEKAYFWDYQPIGNRFYIDPNGKVQTKVTEELDVLRITDIENKSALAIKEFKQAHCCACPSSTCSGGYFGAIAPEICNNNNIIITNTTTTVAQL